jgi:protein-tyrosine phosphatase
LEERGIILIKKDADDSDRFHVLQEELLSDALSTASQAKEQDGALLVQCWGGCNRAPSLAVALLMFEENMDVVEAAAHVMARRGAVLTNRSFRRRLVTLAYRENSRPICLETLE